MSKILGKYQHARSENLDEYFKTLQLPYLVRKMINMSNPRIEVTNEGDKWIVMNVTMVRTQVWEFTLGTEWEEVMPSGVKLKIEDKRPKDRRYHEGEGERACPKGTINVCPRSQSMSHYNPHYSLSSTRSDVKTFPVSRVPPPIA
ncbi:hypothetical protein G9C98_001573 [Cotesia typhae]|uniref:Uncharacterized protein n=1 Tax=Cotesia typhae TaxID=2053667 RepID=A0A8J5QK87_9HYME|nr:hypothetical protein G9C98_001573 [Cotesia typhae]